MIARTEVLIEGLRFPEGCRWHDGRLWFSDMHSGTIYEAGSDGRAPRAVFEIDDQPSGLGWLPDGSVVVSAMLSRRLLRWTPERGVELYADLSDATDHPINDLTITDDGRIFVGGFGYDLYGDAPQAPGPLFRVDPDRSIHRVADDLVFPNGMAILRSGVLVVAETWAARLSAFDIGRGGELGARRVWAELPEGSTPDGIAVDAEDGVWVASIVPRTFLRVTAGGTVTDVWELGDRLAEDCVLGGDDGRTLFLATSNSWSPPETEAAHAGRIESVRVDVRGPHT
ncbi:SMP-30/gluconolactonase/LRE family protein [Microbacterium sp. RD1]|uniref:SMP-30/gluconolactonase/LRE family protein n=1 Tax=Microbacterium sp. RD1 TaxID=3457313 RepID=UPI003FA543F9